MVVSGDSYARTDPGPILLQHLTSPWVKHEVIPDWVLRVAQSSDGQQGIIEAAHSGAHILMLQNTDWLDFGALMIAMTRLGYAGEFMGTGKGGCAVLWRKDVLKHLSGGSQVDFAREAREAGYEELAGHGGGALLVRLEGKLPDKGRGELIITGMVCKGSSKARRRVACSIL